MSSCTIKKLYNQSGLTSSNRGNNMRAEVSTLFGLNVYTDKGVYVGKVNDLVLDPNESKISGLAVGKINPELVNKAGKGVILPYRWVIASGDIIIIKQMTHRFKKEAAEPEKESD